MERDIFSAQFPSVKISGNTRARFTLTFAFAVLFYGLFFYTPPGQSRSSVFQGAIDRLNLFISGRDKDSAEAKRLTEEAAGKIKEYFYWGGLISSFNTSLTDSDAFAIGRAIKHYSEMYRLSPRLVAATILVESGGNIRAVSPMGARGLMQVMPWWTEKLGVKDDLFSVDSNIRIGCMILSENIRKWGYREGILRYYRGAEGPDDGYFVKIQTAMEELAG